MRFIIFMGFVCILCISIAYGGTLTESQQQYLNLIDQELRANHPTYTGMIGSGDSFSPIGIDEDVFDAEIAAMDLSTMVDDYKKPKKDIGTKFKGLGFTDAEIDIIIGD